MIASHAGIADSSERYIFICNMHDDIIYATSSWWCVPDHVPSFWLFAEIIEGEWLFSWRHEVDDRLAERFSHGGDREDWTKYLFCHDRGVKSRVFNKGWLYETCLSVAATSVYDLSIFEISGDSFECLVIDHSYVVPVRLDVLSMKVADLFSECLYKCLLDVFVDKEVVRGDAGLPAVKCLAPCNSSCSHLYVCSLVYDAWTLAAKFKNHWSEVSGCCFHYTFGKCGAACEENKIPSAIEQSFVHIPVTLNHSDIPFLKGIANHFFNDFWYVRHIRRWFKYSSATWWYCAN